MLQPTFGGIGAFLIGDAFVAKLNRTGSKLVYSTYLGGSDDDESFGIAVDRDGQAYVAGLTLSTHFPVTPGAFQTTFGGSGVGVHEFGDGFVTKINRDATSLVYSTYLGGSDGDFVNGIALDALGNAYLVGGTASANFPVTANAIQPKIGGCSSPPQGSLCDAFVTILNPSGSGLRFSTFLGGSSDEEGDAIVRLPDREDIFVAGTTFSTDFPTTPGAFDTTEKGASDFFVTRINTGIKPFTRDAAVLRAEPGAKVLPGQSAATPQQLRRLGRLLHRRP